MIMDEWEPVPPVTVGMPVYNGQRYLAAALDAILEQTYGDFWLVISDNASTDATEEICRDACRRDARVRYERHTDNRGGAWNFNRVAQVARSPYLRYATHDDLVEPTLLEACVQAAKADPAAVLWYPRTVRIDEHGQRTGVFEDSLDLGEARPDRRFRRFLDQYKTANPFYGLMRRQALMSTRLMGKYDSADVVLLAEIALRGRFVEIPELLFLRRIHDESSHPAGATHAEVQSWFDPGASPRYSFRRTRLFGEMVRGVVSSPLAPAERALAAGQLFRAWGPRYGRVVLGEFKRAAFAGLGRPRWQR